MKNIILGSIHTAGTLIICDPCYKKNSKSVKYLDVLSGNYQASVITGKLKKPICAADKLNFYFRVAQLKIVHENYLNHDLKYEDTGIMLGIDSGQACFFDPSTYQKPLKEKYNLEGELYEFWFLELVEASLRLKRNQEMLKEKEKNELYNRLIKLKHLNTHKKLVSMKKTENEFLTLEIQEAKEILKNKKYPDFSEMESTKKFDDMIRSLSSGENHAGIYKNEGVVSRSGLGDFDAKLMVAKNVRGKIVGAYLEFISLNKIR